MAALILVACDSGEPPAGQAQAPNAAASAAGEDIVGPNGEKAVLIRQGKGGAAPDSPFLSPDGTPMTLAAFRGRPLLVNLWATWCAPCKAEMPQLAALARANVAGDGPRVIAISENMGGTMIARRWLEDNRLIEALPAYADPKNDLLFAIGGAGALPTTLYYDAEGREIWRVVGPLDWTSARARALLAEG